MNDRCDIAIIGAGAAGLAAGIFAAEAARDAGSASTHIVLLDGAKTLGAKILVSGGGRCNVTHDEVFPEDYNASRTLVRNVLAAFDEKAAVRWMESLGVNLKREDTGKLFPVSDSAKTVLNALLARLQQLNVDVRPGCRVTAISASDGFRITHTLGDIEARCVILATGGRSLPRSGSDGFGWEIAKKLGHTVTPTYPALVPLVLDPAMFHASVSGLSHPAELSTFVDGKLIDRRTGSLLWTHFGISGPVVMDASRFWTSAQGTKVPVVMRCSFVPRVSFEALEKQFVELGSMRPKLSVVKAVAERLPERLAEAVVRHGGIDPSLPMGQLSKLARRDLVHGLTGLVLPILRDRGWNYAEVTAGGIPLGEVDFRTMQSRKTPGLFLAGEILDCDGRIGGFNFQWAWATGYLAGRGADKTLRTKQ